MEPATRSSHVTAALHQLRRPALLLLLVIMVGALSGRSTADQVLYPGDSLYTGGTLTVSSYELVMQSDCNLVLYDDSVYVWSTGTSGAGSNCHVSMQYDGNLVVYNGEGKPVWASHTDHLFNGYYALVLQRDRNLVIYGSAVWDTRTNPAGAKASIPKDAVLTSSSSSSAAAASHGGAIWAAGTNSSGGTKDSIPKDAAVVTSSSSSSSSTSHGGAGGVVVGGGRKATAGAVAGGNGSKN